MAKKKKPKKIRTETVEEFLERGGGIRMLNNNTELQRLLFSSGHFEPKRNQRGKYVPRRSK